MREDRKAGKFKIVLRKETMARLSGERFHIRPNGEGEVFAVAGNSVINACPTQLIDTCPKGGCAAK